MVIKYFPQWATQIFCGGRSTITIFNECEVRMRECRCAAVR